MTTERTRCGTPRAGDAGSRTTVYGWVDRRRDMGGLIFLDLRDTTGLLQIVINPQTAPDAHARAHDARLEYVLKVTGEIRRRDTANVNPKVDTGEVELHAADCTVLAVAKTPPFPVNDDSDVDEKLRLQYRYLDLRRPRLQRNLRKRAEFIAALRAAMMAQDFIEIETPMMIRATPEGARDYLIPSRVFPGNFYALPQSPQLYKQLSMVAGFDRYFQIAHCMRDEDLRADRQPEFSQLDVEMSFVDEEDVFEAIEYGISTAWNRVGFRGTVSAPFPRMTWKEAMDRFGVDKPDTRFGLELCDLTDIARECGFRVFNDVVTRGGVVKAICVRGGADMNRGLIEGELTAIVKTFRAKGLAYLWRNEDGWSGSIAKFFTEAELESIGTSVDAHSGDAVLMVADSFPVASAALGALRNHLGRSRSLYETGRIDMLWITEFPMYEKDEDTGEISPAHHPFTQVNPEDIDRLDDDPLSVRARAYDLVVNGREVASGSIRITDPEMQRRIFRAMKISDEDAQAKFGFLLEAFEYGAPPHGGCAPGIERLVMEGLGEENIRDVVAFPKNQQAQELMTSAPAPVDEKQLRELGLQLLPLPPRS